MTKVPNYQCSKLPCNRATLQQVRETKCKKQSARIKVQETKNKKRKTRTEEREPKNENRRTRTEEREPKNKILGAKTSEQKAPNFHFLDGKIDQKSDFWNIVLRCSES